MHSRSLHLGVAAARRLAEFAGVERLLDVAGGSGCFSIALAQRHPEMRCTVMELARVAKLARGYIAEFGLEGRVDTLVANMFADPWPPGYDAVFLSNILHDWDRARGYRAGADGPRSRRAGSEKQDADHPRLRRRRRAPPHHPFRRDVGRRFEGQDRDRLENEGPEGGGPQADRAGRLGPRGDGG